MIAKTKHIGKMCRKVTLLTKGLRQKMMINAGTTKQNGGVTASTA